MKLLRTLLETSCELKPAKQFRNEIQARPCCGRAVWLRSVAAASGRVVTRKQNFCHFAVMDLLGGTVSGCCRRWHEEEVR
jgi:hypothetical protein